MRYSFCTFLAILFLTKSLNAQTYHPLLLEEGTAWSQENGHINLSTSQYYISKCDINSLAPQIINNKKYNVIQYHYTNKIRLVRATYL
jgi:hypothetical protein